MTEYSVKPHVLDFVTGTWQTIVAEELAALSMSNSGRTALLSTSGEVSVRSSYGEGQDSANLVLRGKPIAIALERDGDDLLLVERITTMSAEVDVVLHLYDAITLTSLQDPWVMPEGYEAYHGSAWIDGRLVALLTSGDRRTLASSIFVSGARYSHCLARRLRMSS